MFFQFFNEKIVLVKVFLFFFLSFTLLRSRQRKASVKIFRSELSADISEIVCVEWQNLTPHFAMVPQRRNENINKLLLYLQSHTCALRKVWLHFVREMKYLYKIYISITSLWLRGKVRRRVSPLNTKCLQNFAESRERSVLTPGSLCLPT